MKIYILLVFVICFFSTHEIPAQAYFNLKNLKQVTVTVMDEGNFISSTIQQKLVTEIKLKLKTAGLTIAGREKWSEFRVDVRAVKTNDLFPQYKLLLNVFLIEEALLERMGSQRISVVTYYDDEFWIIEDKKEVEKAAYDKIMDVMLVRFIDRYLDQNPGN
jgi:hypothetical protein